MSMSIRTLTALVGMSASAFLFSTPQTRAADSAPTLVPADLFAASDPNLEITVWAASPAFRNPTNMDTDAFGRIWVAEGVNYRKHYNRIPEGDRIIVLEDSNGDGTADDSWTFVQEPFLQAPMGVAVIDNQIIVSMTPDLIVYTDVNRNARFDKGIDTREVLLTGFNGRVHDHSIHSVTVGPNGQWYWNAGNCGALFTDRSGKTFRIGSSYDPYYGRKPAGDLGWDPREIAGQRSDDGHVYVGGFAARMNPDGTNARIIGHNFRNSYEQVVTAYGDVFQNDNDDPPACRTAFLMEYGNAGFSSFDGQRSWQADRRPGQSVPTAQWRQEDPGTMPAGDVYGGGSPTGIAFVEESALGKQYRGLLLSCEPGRNVVFGYYPKPQGAGFKLDRFDFMTSNQSGNFAGGDYTGGNKSVTNEIPTFFRPSDVLVGADGAIYVADFFDPRVGGHNDMDETLSGTIYRIAPKGFRPSIPKADLSSLEGALTAFKSPAVNVRGAAFHALKKRGNEASKPVEELLEDENPYVRARTIWLLSQLSDRGARLVRRLSKDPDPQTRLVAFRALRHLAEAKGSQGTKDLMTLSRRASKDDSPAVRREAALALRDLPLEQSIQALWNLAQKYDGEDRWMLEAIGIGATGKESALYNRLQRRMKQTDPIQWSPAFASLAWRLHPEESATAFGERATSRSLSIIDRKAAVTALAYIGSEDAVTAILNVAQNSAGAPQADAFWWLLNRKDSEWKAYRLNAELKKRGIYDPDDVQLISSSMPLPALDQAPSIESALQLDGNIKSGKLLIGRCIMCHRFGNMGTDVGPDLTAFGRAQTREVIAQGIILPSADIAHGYGAHVIETTDDLRIEGLIVTDRDPVVMVSAGGILQMIPKDRIRSQKPLGRSLMWTPQSLGLTDQDVADLVAYFKSL